MSSRGGFRVVGGGNNANGPGNGKLHSIMWLPRLVSSSPDVCCPKKTSSLLGTKEVVVVVCLFNSTPKTVISAIFTPEGKLVEKKVA